MAVIAKIIPSPNITTELNFDVSSIKVKEKNFKKITIVAIIIASTIN